MSSRRVTGGGSRPSNGSNPAYGGREANTAVHDSAEERELPTVEERLSGLWNRFPKKMRTPISTDHGQRLREEALAEAETVKREIEVGEHESRTIVETVARDALPLGYVVEAFLDWYESYRGKRLRMARGDGYHEDRETFTVDLENSFQPGYQRQTYARLQGLQRQTVGGEYPDGSEAAGEFDDAVTVLLSLTASGTTDGGGPRPAADHARSIRDAWVGSSSSTKRTLRYVLEDKLGLETDEYAWWFQAEPHPGDGANAGYSHAHPVVVIDGSSTAVEPEAITAETFRPVIAKHVAECEPAGWEAHRLDDAVELKEPGEVEDFASYVAEYIAVDPDEDLLERPGEYLLWAATQWATTSQKYSKSATATASLNADKCRQRYRDPEAKQDHDHGEEVCRVDGARQCAACGEAFGVSQQGTLVEARRSAGGESASNGGRPASADTAEKAASSDGESDVPEWASDVGDRWPSAREAGVTGSALHDSSEKPEWSVSESTGRKPPSWEAEAIVTEEEETFIGRPGGVDYGEVVVEGAESISRTVDRHLQPEWLEGARPWERHPVSEEAVRSGELPPPELVHREFRELRDGQRLTPKRWEADWYGQRHGGREEEELVEVPESRVRQLADTSSLSAVGICGRLEIDPAAVGKVESIVETVR